MFGRMVDKAVRQRRGHQHRGVLRGIQIEPAARVPFYAQKFSPGIGFGPVEIRAHGNRVDLDVGDTLSLEQKRPDEYEEGHEARNRISRQPDEIGFADAAERERPARLHRSEEHTSELQSLAYLVCRLLLEKK